MVKVMILDHVLNDVIEIERELLAADYAVVKLTGAYSVLSKLDYECPDILILNPEIPHLDVSQLLLSVRGEDKFAQMIIIFISRGEPESVEALGRECDVHGYFMKGGGGKELVNFLAQFIEAV